MNGTRREVALVTGAEGFVGGHLLPRLVANGWDVYATHRLEITPDAVGGVTWLPCNLTQEGVTHRWPTGCDRVVFLAQAQSWRDFPLGAEEMFQVNVEAVWQTVEYARRVGARSFVFASTGSLYTDKTRANSELDPVHLTAPRSFYTATKLAAEGLLGPYSSCMNILIARLYFPYGSGQNPAMLLPQLVQRVRDGNPIQLHGPDGLLLSPTTVEDVAESLTRLLKQDQSATVNVAGPEVLSLRTISEIIGREINRPACFEAHREEPTEVMAGKTDRLRAILHWAPETSFEEGLRRWLSTPTPPTHCGNGSSTQKGRAPSNPR